MSRHPAMLEETELFDSLRGIHHHHSSHSKASIRYPPFIYISTRGEGLQDDAHRCQDDPRNSDEDTSKWLLNQDADFVR